MNRAEKERKVAQYDEVVQEAGFAILAEHGSMSVPDVESLRRELRAAGCKAVVMKNTLARIVFERHGLSEVCEHLMGPTVVLYGQDDIAMAAKLLQKHSRRFPALAVKAVLFDGKVYPREEFRTFTTMPSTTELRSMFASVIQAPVVQFVRVLGAAQRMVTVLRSYADQRES
jgi:large subunit ribosomal protein L10